MRSDYGVCWANAATYPPQQLKGFPLCICFQMLRYHKNPITVNGDAGGMSGALWPARGGGWLPYSRSLSQYPVIGPLLLTRVCICVQCVCLYVPCQALGWRAAPWARTAELLWRHSVSLEMLGTAEIVQAASFFHKVQVRDFFEDVPHLTCGGIVQK